MTLASVLSFLRVAWPILSFVVSLLSGIHAAGAHADALAHKDGADTISAQAVHVLGAGGISGVTLLAGAAGVAMNHARAVAAPSKPPPGVSPVLHQMDVLHSVMLEDPMTTAGELDGLNNLIKSRMKTP